MSFRLGCFAVLIAGGALATRLRPFVLLQSSRLFLRAATPLLLAVKEGLPPCGDGTEASPRVAADEARARVVMDAWEADPDIRATHLRGKRLVSEPCVYGDETPLHGLLVWAEEPGSRDGGWMRGIGTDAAAVGRGAPVGAEEQPGASAMRRPGVLLVHTAVGPHDLFLRWRAESLAASGHVVLIVDCLGDATGKGWDPAWSGPARKALAATPGLLRRRMLSGLAALSASPRVDASRIAACGFCFGGRAVLELAKANPDGLKLVVSFHGVVDAAPPPPGVNAMRARALLFHGDADPFVPPDVLAACIEQLRQLGAGFELHSYGGVRHAFTNPAQELNPNPAFGYDARAAQSSWQMALTALEGMQA
jgi:dienelactone hydrolase